MLPARLVAAVVLTLSLACASTPRPPAAKAGPAVASATPQQAQQGPKREKVVCEWERPTGSNIPERVCRTQTTIDETRLRTQDEMRAASHQTPPRGN